MNTRIHLFYASIIFFLLTSCSDDLCEQEVTYTKAVANYGHLDDLREENLNAGPRSLVKANKIFISGDQIFISDSREGIHIIDNSDPSNPQFVNFILIPGNAEFTIKDKILYADSYYDFLKIDITNPLNVAILTRLEVVFEPAHRGPNETVLLGFERKRVTEKLSCSEHIFQDDLVFVDFDGGRIPESAIPTAFVSNGAGHVGTANRIAQVDDFLYLIDMSSIFTFSDGDQGFRKVNNLNDIGFNLETIFSSNDALFLGGRNGMEIFDISQRESPRHLSSFWHATSCDPVLPTEYNVAYITLRSDDECPGTLNTLNVVDISNLNNPFQITSHEMISPYGMTIIETHLYVGEGESGFRVFDISNPREPSEVTRNSSISAFDIIAHPTNESILLFAHPLGLSQYMVDQDHLSLISEISL